MVGGVNLILDPDRFGSLGRLPVAQARAELAAQWGDTGTSFADVAGELRVPERTPDLDTLLRELGRNPDVARWASERSERQ